MTYKILAFRLFSKADFFVVILRQIANKYIVFNTSFLKDTCVEASFARDIFPFLQIKKKQITHYDHFFDDHGTEIIVLPSYISNENVNILSEHNFTVLKNCVITNETGCFAYRKNNENQSSVQIAKKYDVVVMTLFYEESRDELQMFYDYYRARGVEHFYMYYNGKLNDELDIPRESDITYIEWDYYYWYCADGQSYHHAQIPAMISFYKRFLPKCEAALMIDTDEFLQIDDTLNLKEYLKLHKAHNKNLFSSHHWAKLDREYNIISSNKADHDRGKSIVYSDACPLEFFPNVHKVSNSIFFSALKLLHNKKHDQLLLPYRVDESYKIFEIPEEHSTTKPYVINNDDYEFYDYSYTLKPTGIYKIPNVYVDKDFIYDKHERLMNQFTWLNDSYTSAQLSYLHGSQNSNIEILKGNTLYLASTWGCQNIGHAIMDGLSRMACYDAAGLSLSDYDYVLVNELTSETFELTQMMGIPFSKIKSVRSSKFLCDSLTISEMPGRKRQYKTIVGDYFRRVTKDHFAEHKPERNGMILLNRKTRKPINSADIYEFAKSHNLNIHTSHPSKNDFYNADVIVSPHSSTLCKLLWCRPHTKVIEFISTEHPYSYYYEWCRIFDLDYIGILCQAETTKHKSPLLKDFTINTDILKLAL